MNIKIQQFAQAGINFADWNYGRGGLTIDQIAESCHEANRVYCQSIGDDSQLPWDEAPQWQRDSACNGVRFRLNNPDSLPSASHDNWWKEKIEAGWVYGPVKDETLKQHPCCVSYEELPEAQRLKDGIFQTVVDSLKGALVKTIWEGNKSDERQTANAELSDEHRLFRKRYRQLSQEEVALHDKIKDTADELAALFFKVAPVHLGPVENRERGANVSLAIRHLEDAVYRAVKGLTA